MCSVYFLSLLLMTAVNIIQPVHSNYIHLHFLHCNLSHFYLYFGTMPFVFQFVGTFYSTFLIYVLCLLIIFLHSIKVLQGCYLCHVICCYSGIVLLFLCPVCLAVLPIPPRWLFALMSIIYGVDMFCCCCG